MAQATQHKPALLAGFARLAEQLGQAGPEWLRRARTQALARFEELGFPTSRLEEWKNTNVAPIARTPFVPAPDRREELSAERPGGRWLDGISAHRLVFVNGRYAPRLSNTGGIPEESLAGSLAEALRSRPEQLEGHLGRYANYDDRAFPTLTTAFLEDGALVIVPDGVELDEPIQLLYLSTGDDEPTASHPRTLVLTGANSRTAIVETFASLNGRTYFTNAVTELRIGPNAQLDHYRIQDESPAAYHVGTLRAHQERNSRFTSNNFDLGSSLARLDTDVVLDGDGAECTLNGLYLTRDKQHVDNHSTLDHAKPHCQSRELYKGILNDRSRAVFNGRIIVRPGAQKTDAKQSNPNLLLSDGALVHTRPQLEIYADDVKCTHGATIGRLDEDAQFYLRSRGIPAEEARQLLIRAFAREVLERVAIEPLREQLEQELTRRLGEGRSEP